LLILEIALGLKLFSFFYLFIFNNYFKEQVSFLTEEFVPVPIEDCLDGGQTILACDFEIFLYVYFEVEVEEPLVSVPVPVHVQV